VECGEVFVSTEEEEEEEEENLLELGFLFAEHFSSAQQCETELAPLPLLPFALESYRSSSSYHLVCRNASHAFLLSALQRLLCSNIFFHAVLVCCCS